MFADEFAKLSGNKIKVDIYPNSQLSSIKDNLAAVQLGTLSMAIAVPAWFAGFAKQMDVFPVEEGRGMLKTKGRILKSLIEDRKREAKR